MLDGGPSTVTCLRDMTTFDTFSHLHPRHRERRERVLAQDLDLAVRQSLSHEDAFVSGQDAGQGRRVFLTYSPRGSCFPSRNFSKRRKTTVEVDPCPGRAHPQGSRRKMDKKSAGRLVGYKSVLFSCTEYDGVAMGGLSFSRGARRLRCSLPPVLAHRCFFPSPSLSLIPSLSAGLLGVLSYAVASVRQLVE